MRRGGKCFWLYFIFLVSSKLGHFALHRHLETVLFIVSDVNVPFLYIKITEHLFLKKWDFTYFKFNSYSSPVLFFRLEMGYRFGGVRLLSERQREIENKKL